MKLFLTSSVVITLGIVTVRESDAARSLDENHVGDSVPGVLVVGQGQVLVGAERALLGESTEKARAARSTVGPERNGISGRVALRLHKPVVEVLRASHLDVTGELVEVNVQRLSAGKTGDLIGQSLGGVVRKRGAQTSQDRKKSQHGY